MGHSVAHSGTMSDDFAALHAALLKRCFLTHCSSELTECGSKSSKPNKSSKATKVYV